MAAVGLSLTSPEHGSVLGRKIKKFGPIVCKNVFWASFGGLNLSWMGHLS